ncbi:ABC transporter ATP-binding protein [Methylocapsa acidiphila]|uniref:ABC transporter ATP-binding protein n=1 Tax=Methylocapsa acidiphila TaxID=133552 RepID=UPI0003FCE12A|nr:ABC transporter ATP-binding protein [Methylocapsa acidiphila]
MTETALSLRGVSKFYGSGERRVLALRDASVEIATGELLGIIGPSGSGKTTFLMLAGLVEPPTQGEIWFLGRKVADPRTRSGELRKLRGRHIGFVFQKANLLPFLTAAENVQVASAAVGRGGSDARRRACELLEELGLAHRLDAYPQTLSGGEQQRVALARAIANRPTLLLADEPTAALDSDRRGQVMGLLSGLARDEGVTVCVVTHDVRAISFFDKIVEISDGEIAGTPAPPPASRDGEPLSHRPSE